MYILKTIEISKSYDKAQIIAGIDFNMHEGDYIAVMGPSGAGKSTFMHLISGMDKPTSGKTYIGDSEIASLNEKSIAHLRLKHIGMVFQKPSLLSTLTVIDNVMLPAYMLKEESPNGIKERAVKLLAQFEIADKMNVPVNTLSGGELQRACIARALINNPLIIFADEPTGALNSSATEKVLDVLKDVNNAGTAILIVTHDIRVATRAKKVIYLLDGMIKDEIVFPKQNSLHDREQQIATWISDNHHF